MILQTDTADSCGVHHLHLDSHVLTEKEVGPVDSNPSSSLPRHDGGFYPYDLWAWCTWCLDVASHKQQLDKDVAEPHLRLLFPPIGLRNPVMTQWIFDCPRIVYDALPPSHVQSLLVPTKTLSLVYFYLVQLWYRLSIFLSSQTNRLCQLNE